MAAGIRLGKWRPASDSENGGRHATRKMGAGIRLGKWRPACDSENGGRHPTRKTAASIRLGNWRPASDSDDPLLERPPPVFSRLSAGAKAIEDGVRSVTGATGEVFMMHPKFGSVTCCPSNIGTGMRGSLPAAVFFAHGKTCVGQTQPNACFKRIGQTYGSKRVSSKTYGSNAVVKRSKSRCLTGQDRVRI